MQARLFTDTRPQATYLSIGAGFYLEWVDRPNKVIRIYRYGVLFKQVTLTTGIERRRLVVELIVEGGVSKKHLAEALGVSRSSIDTWLACYEKSGFEGLINSYKGSREAGRQDHADKLPEGNKARQVEQERQRQRAENQAERQAVLEYQQSLDFAPPSRAVEIERPIVAEEAANLFTATFDYQENRYAGGFIYWVIFQGVFGLMDFCRAKIGDYAVVIYLFVMMLIQRIPSVEQLKVVFKSEFGNLLGINQLWSRPVLWELIHGVCELQVSAAMLEEYFMKQAREGAVLLAWLYLDGHFVPWYGQAKIHKGFYTQRDLMMPGQTEMYVHDQQGQIVYCEVQEGQGDIKEMMRRMSEQWSAFLAQPPLIVVDRAAWGVAHFLSMTGYWYVTWEKYGDAAGLATLLADCFGQPFIVHDIAYRAYEERKVYSDDKGNAIEMRRIVIWNTHSDWRGACVAPVAVSEKTDVLATAMLGRWGCSENTFKHMSARFPMHYNPVVDASQNSPRQEVANPEHAHLKKELADLKRALKKCKQELGSLPVTLNKDGSLRQSGKRERLLQERVDLQTQIEAKSAQVNACPERVTISAEEEYFKALDTEGRNLWNLAQAIVWNSRKKLLAEFEQILPNPRDLIPVLEAITTGRGWIKSTEREVIIRLEPLEIPRFRATQERLCQVLTDKQARLGNCNKILILETGLNPLDVQ